MNPPKIDIGEVKNNQIYFPQLHAPTEKIERTPNLDPFDQKIGFAVIGLGRISVNQMIPAFQESKHAKLVAVVSGRPKKAELIAQQYNVPFIYNYQNFDSIKDNRQIQAVYIALPPFLHLEYTRRAALAGKHILCEKPMALNINEAKEMITVCQQNNRKLMIGYRMQYDVFSRKLIEMCKNGDLGTIKNIVSCFYQNMGNPQQWRLKKDLAGGGSLFDIGIYCLNAARFLTGEEPIQLSSQIVNDPNDPRFQEVDQNVNWNLVFPSGSTASLSCDFNSHELSTLIVNGTDRSAQLHPAYSYQGQKLILSTLDNQKNKAQIDLQLQHQNQFRLELDHFAECIQNNLTPRTPGEEGLQDLFLMEKIYLSAQKNGQIIKLPHINKLDAFRGPPLGEIPQ